MSIYSKNFNEVCKFKNTQRNILTKIYTLKINVDTPAT